jgi:hypothetical protein
MVSKSGPRPSIRHFRRNWPMTPQRRLLRHGTDFTFNPCLQAGKKWNHLNTLAPTSNVVIFAIFFIILPLSCMVREENQGTLFAYGRIRFIRNGTRRKNSGLHRVGTSSVLHWCSLDRRIRVPRYRSSRIGCFRQTTLLFFF